MTDKKESKEQKARSKQFDLDEREKNKQLEQTDILSNYLNNSNFISGDPIEQCEATKKAITFGLRLLPNKFDDEKDQTIVDKIRNDASTLLGEETGDRKISFTYSDQGGKRFPLYAIETQGTSDDEGIMFQAEAERLEIVEKSFVHQQYSKHLVKLQKIENDIGVALVNYDVIHRMTRKQLMDKMITKKFERRYLKELEKGKKEVK